MANPISGLAQRLNGFIPPQLESPFLIDYQKPYGLDMIDFNLIPLKSTIARAQIFDGVAKVELQHDYSNESDKTLETSFKFPVSPDCAVTSLVIHTQDKELVAKIVAREKAQQKYDDAIASGNVAYQLEYDADSSEVLSMKIGNMAPGQQISIRINFLVRLPVFDKSWAFVLSPTLTPCLPVMSVNNSKSAIPSQEIAAFPGAHIVNKGELEIDIISHTAITRLTCLSHISDMKFGEMNMTAHLSLKKEDSKNFQLLLRSEDINVPKVFCQRNSEYPGEIAALISFFPNFVEKTKPSQEQKGTTVDTSTEKEYENEQEEDELQGAGQFIFVLDRSGSMGGTNIEMAREAARLFLLSLPSDSRFNIVSFGSSYFSMYAQSVVYSQQTLQKAVTAILSFDADLGGTQIYQPLSYIYNTPTVEGYPRNIFLVTDGEVSSPQNVVGLIGKHSSEARVHTFGIGSGASEYLVKQAALAGKGSYQFISDGQSNMSAKVISSLSQALKPALVNIRTQWSNPGAIKVQGPSSLPNTFHNEPLILGAIIDEQASLKEMKLTLQCNETKGRKLLKFVLPLSNSVQLPEGEELFALCAKSRIKELQLQDFSHQESEALSLKYKVLSKATGMVAVQKMKSKLEGDLVQVQIPCNVTKPIKKNVQQFNLFGCALPLPVQHDSLGLFSAPVSQDSTSYASSNLFSGISQKRAINQQMAQPFGMSAPPPQMGGLPFGNSQSFGMGAPPPPPGAALFSNFGSPGMGAPIPPPPPPAAAPPSKSSISPKNLLDFDGDCDKSNFQQAFARKKKAAAPPKPSAAPTSFFDSGQAPSMQQQQGSGFDLLSLQDSVGMSPTGAIAPPKNDLLDLQFSASEQAFFQSKEELPPAVCFDMNSLLSLQQFDGSWNLNASFQVLVKQSGKNIQITPHQELNKGLSEEDKKKIWATAIAVWILSNMFVSRKGEWKRITTKSSKLLKGMGIELKAVLELVASTIK